MQRGCEARPASCSASHACPAGWSAAAVATIDSQTAAQARARRATAMGRCQLQRIGCTS